MTSTVSPSTMPTTTTGDPVGIGDRSLVTARSSTVRPWSASCTRLNNAFAQLLR